MGELHLDIIVDRLRREYKVECDVGAPQVLPSSSPASDLSRTYPNPKSVLCGRRCTLRMVPFRAVGCRMMGYACPCRSKRSAGLCRTT